MYKISVYVVGVCVASDFLHEKLMNLWLVLSFAYLLVIWTLILVIFSKRVRVQQKNEKNIQIIQFIIHLFYNLWVVDWIGEEDSC